MKTVMEDRVAIRGRVREGEDDASESVGEGNWKG